MPQGLPALPIQRWLNGVIGTRNLQQEPKRPYLSVADRIAASIGSFNAIHVRRGDFLRNELTKRKITRTTSVSGEEIVANLASRMHRDDPLVICTDGASSGSATDGHTSTRSARRRRTRRTCTFTPKRWATIHTSSILTTPVAGRSST